MATHDYVIANGTGAAVRSDLNGAFAAIVSQNSSASEPSPTYAYMSWADTTAGVMKMRNGSNSGWISLYQLDGEWTSIAIENGTAAAPSFYFRNSGTDTGIYSPGTDQLGISTAGVSRLIADNNGCITIGTSSGSTKSVWLETLDSQTSVNNVGFLVQPPSVYNVSGFGNYPIYFSNAVTCSGTASLQAVNIRNHIAATASGAEINALGLYVRNVRNSTSDLGTASPSSTTMTALQTGVFMGTNLPAATTVSYMQGQNNVINFQAGTATTGTIGHEHLYRQATGTNNTASNVYHYGYEVDSVLGAASGTGTATLTELVGYRTTLTIYATGQVTNYYGIFLRINAVTGTLTNRWSIYSQDAASPMYHAGSIGIGTSTPTYQLQLSTDSAGKPSTNTWTVVSDERIKEDIELANLDICYEAVKNIPLKRFKWRDEVYSAEQVGDRRKLGWIAQDVEAVFPKAVRIKEFKYNQKYEETIIPAIKEKLDKDGNEIVKGQPERIDKKLISEDVIEDCRDLNADQLYAAMYGAIQKLMSKVEALEAKVAALQ